MLPVKDGLRKLKDFPVSIWPQMLPALHRLRERVFTNMSHQFEFTITSASFNGSKAANLQ
ncbi:MAG: hypothetical protein DME98_13990 [Verrucomicrobia bacterium]|nr:MAG: hypothetical protein DME98_13990 [Verrucomicrobiota bacterium]PYJ35197.1 MAG: hypothetical protein DME88_02670 [Verrucomicrobiota bacterium]